MGARRCTQVYFAETVTDEPEGAAPCPEGGDRDLSELSRHELGELGEDIAAAHLADTGLVVIERNYRCSEGEADIVAVDEDEGSIVLVEVKTRRADAGGGFFAEEAVDAAKRRRYRRIAAAYLMEHFPVPAIRFDVIAVTVPKGGPIEVHHVPGAFDWDAQR
ncbi:MAG: YraN family protein [Coriobacteriaceae bacterium]|nr:YraN family protein [Coriobacteriaceae bacterium]